MLSILALHLSLVAQCPVIRHYSHDEGLNANTIYTMVQDKIGYLWFATDNGLFRYDGKQFTRYSTQNGLPDNDILSIGIDAKDRLWLACYNYNLLCVEHGNIHNGRGGNKFMTFPSYLKNLGMDQNRLLFQVNGNAQAVAIYPDGSLRSFKQPDCHLMLENGRVFFIKNKLIFYYASQPLSDTIKLTQPNEFFLSVHKVSSQSFLAKTNNRILLFTEKNNQITYREWKSPQWNTFLFFNMGDSLWIHDGTSLIPVTKSLVLDTARKRNTQHISFSNFFLDRNQDLWLMTEGDGVYYLPQIPIRYLTEKDGLYHQNIITAAVYKDSLFTLGLSGRVNCITESKVYSTPFNIQGRYPGKVKAMFVNSTHLVFGYSSGYMLMLDRKTGKEKMLDRVGSIKHFNTFSEDTLLFCSSSMTGLLIIPTAKVINLFSKRSVSASRLKDNTLLIAGINELNLFRLQDTLLFPLNNISVQNTIASDIQSVPGLTAITTFEQGVFLWSGKQNLNFTVKNGLCDNSCKSICIDHENELWVTTSSGLNHIFRNDRTQPFFVEHLSIKNGLISNDLNQLFHIKSLYYVTSSKGISVFSKALFQPSDAEPVMDIHDIEINHRPHFEQQDLHLKAGEQHLKVTISAIDYRSFGNLNFRYKVDGLDSTWNYTSNQEIAFEQLQPGRYQLIVQSVNSLNHISKNVKTLRFTVHPFWWQRTGVQLLLALAILALGFYVLYRYLQKRYLLKLEQEKLLKQLSETELKAIKAQINPHFIFNTLNAIQFFISNNENDRAIIYLNLMSKLIRNTLDISNEISIPLHREIQYIQDYIALEALRFEEDEFEYSCSCDLPENETKQAFPTMVLQPLIENALRHGLKPKKTGKKILQVRFFKKEGYLVATVEDNGIGRKHAALLKSKSSIQHQSQGVNLSQSKLEIFRSQEHRKVKLETEDLFENDAPAGTRVILSIEQ